MIKSQGIIDSALRVNQTKLKMNLLFHCTKYCSFRDEFYKKIENQIPNITQLPPMQATKKLMNSDN